MQATENKMVLFIDHDARKAEIERIETAISKTHDILKLANDTLRMELTDDEKNAFLKKGTTALIDVLRPIFKFPDAEVGFNLKSLGIDLNGLERAYKSDSHHWKTYGIDAGAIIDIENHPAVARHTKYIENANQLKAFKTSKDFCKMLSKIESDGYARPNYAGIDVEAFTELVLWNWKTKQFEPNYRYIQNIK